MSDHGLQSSFGMEKEYLANEPTAVAIDRAIERAKKYGITTVDIRRSGRIACLCRISILEQGLKEDLLYLYQGPYQLRSVAPYGGIQSHQIPMVVGIPI